MLPRGKDCWTPQEVRFVLAELGAIYFHLDVLDAPEIIIYNSKAA
jgi:hypothetical protein